MSVSVAIALCFLALSSENQISVVDRNNVPTPTQQYTHRVVLEEDRFHLYWNFNENHITFEVIVR